MRKLALFQTDYYDWRGAHSEAHGQAVNLLGPQQFNKLMSIRFDSLGWMVSLKMVILSSLERYPAAAGGGL